MISDGDIIRMIFGFKIRYLRQKLGLSYEELAARTGVSRSYLHEMEKGRKYPKPDKIRTLAGELGVDYDFLVSTRADKKLQPFIDLLNSEFVKEFPLEQFGIEPDKLFDLFSNTPDKVNAFINTFFKLTRNYQLQRESLYMAALRSYQDLYDNYFEDLEHAAADFRRQHQLETSPLKGATLRRVLRREFGIETDNGQLALKPELKGIRSYYASRKKVLFLNSALNEAQENFLLGREIAFQALELKPRPYFTRIIETDSFETLLNNFKASYFSIALLMPEQEVVQDLDKVARASEWTPRLLLDLLRRYQVTPETFLQRLTNILPRHFDIRDLFFIRMISDEDLRHYRMTKEIHLSQLHNPYANELNEHYCRRWVSVNIIKNARARIQLEGKGGPITEAQLSRYWETPNEYLCLSMAQADTFQPARTVSVTIGLLVNDRLRSWLRFLGDPALTRRIVNTTCERCNIPDCEARAAPPLALEQKKRRERILSTARELEEED